MSRFGRLGKRSISADALKLRVLMANATSQPVNVVDHGDLSGLADDDHTQYMHISSPRTVTAQHDFAPTTDRAPFTLGVHAQGQLVTGLDADLLDGQHASSFASASHNHDSDYISIIGSPNAGNFPIMTAGGELSTSSYGPSSFVPTSRTVTAGAGLTDGGALSSDITLNVGAGTLISVGENTVGISPGSAQYQFIVSGVSPFTAAWSAGYLNISTGKTLTISANLTSQTGAGVLSWPAAGATLTIPATGTAGVYSTATTGYVPYWSGTPLLLSNSPIQTNGTCVGIGTAANAQYGLDISGSCHVSGYFVGPHAMQVSGAVMLCHYDGQRLYETDFTGETMGHMGQVGTVAGGAIFRPGVFGKGVQISEAATNLCSNPSFEVDTTGWNPAAGISITRVATYSYIGSYCLQATRSSTGTYLYFNASFISGNSYLLSFYARKANGSAITSSDITGAFIQNTGVGVASITEVDNGWYRIISNVRVSSATETNNCGFYMATGTYYFDGFLLINSTYTKPYLDGSLGIGHSWSSTAHASTSSRTASVLSYTNPLTKDAGTIMLYWMPSSANTTAQTSPYLFSEGNLKAYYLAADDKIYFTDGTNTISTSALTFSADVSQFLAFTWSSDGLAIRRYYNSTMDTTVTGGTYTAPTLGANLFIGSDTSSANQCNGIVDELGILNRVITDAEFLAIAKSNAPIFAETSTWAWRSANNLAWADQYGLWMNDTVGNGVLGAYGGSSTRSWGGFTLSPGDLVIGHNTTDMAAILWDQSEGTFGFYGNGNSTAQVEISTTGALTAGNGIVTLDSSGIYLKTISSYNENYTYSFRKSGTSTDIGGMYGIYDGGSTIGLGIQGVATTEQISLALLSTNTSTTNYARVYLEATTDSKVSTITIYAHHTNGTYIDLDADKTFVQNMLGVEVSTVRQQLSVGSYIDIYSGASNSPSVPSIRGNSNDLYISAYSSGSVYLNRDGGTGGIKIYNGSSTEVGSIDNSGNAQFDGNMDIGGVYKINGVQVLQATISDNVFANSAGATYTEAARNIINHLKDGLITHGVFST